MLIYISKLDFQIIRCTNLIILISNYDKTENVISTDLYREISFCRGTKLFAILYKKVQYQNMNIFSSGYFSIRKLSKQIFYPNIPLNKCEVLFTICKIILKPLLCENVKIAIILILAIAIKYSYSKTSILELILLQIEIFIT